MPIRKLLAFVVIAYTIFLLFRIPASAVVPMLENSAGISLQDVNGTLWSGRAKSVRVMDKYLGEIEWSVRPLNFLLGRYSNHFVLGNGETGLRGEGDFTIGPGSRALTNAVFNGRLGDMAALFDFYLPYKFEADVQGDIVVVRLDNDGKIIEATADINLVALTFKQEQHLGDIHFAVAQSGDGPFMVDARSSDGSALDAEGRGELSWRGAVSLDLEFRKLSQAGEAGALLKLISRQEGEKHRLRWQGNITDFY